ncbi:MAG: galactokinase [Ignavibacteriales bacterium]|nr:galactokinase [Ignavibacteriales bacterium]
MELIQNFKEILEDIYGNDWNEHVVQLKRYNNLFELFNKHFDEKDVYIFSTPGRTEISGNHTDHNLGKVLAASINLDSILIASKNNSSEIILYSEGYDKPFKVNINELFKINTEEGTTSSLIKGIAYKIKELGFKLGGFNAFMTSNVLPGSGLSSSASVEVLIGSVFNVLFNENKIDNKEIAKIGQWAENNYFGKPCGLMDQMACALGGIISIDFEDPQNPNIEKVDYNFDKQNYKLLIVDTGGSHADLTNDYASIPNEMKLIAKFFHKNVCREINYSEFLNEIKEIRKTTGDRAILRAFHFLKENERVHNQFNALQKKDFNQFLKLVNDSGNSSFKWLQNIYSTQNVKEQGVSLALALTEEFISTKGEGACRVHGGGFAGTIQVFLHNDYVSEYKNFIETIFGKGKAQILKIRSKGSICLNNY